MKVKLGIVQRLVYSCIIVLIFIGMIAASGHICIRILKKTSHLMVVEFKELEKIQDVLLAVSEIKSPAQAYLNNSDQQEFVVFKSRVSIAKERVEECLMVLTDRHNREYLDQLLTSLQKVESLGDALFRSESNLKPHERYSIFLKMSEATVADLTRLQGLLAETKQEVTSYIKTNETAILHSTITIAALGLLLTFLVIYGSFLLINRITKSSKQLLTTITEVTQGDIHTKVDLKSHDEFGELAQAFNLMLKCIDEITVSRNRYDNILNSMFDGLIVLNRNGSITSLNRKACQLIGDSMDGLVGSSLSEFIKPVEEVLAESQLLSRQGMKIPVLYSFTDLINDDGEIIGKVMVIHDLSHQKEIEGQMDQIKKDRSVAILEAQEKERLRIATDLHDGIVQMLTTVSYSIESMERELVCLNEEAIAKLMETRGLVNTAIAECRRISHNLIPLALHDFGLIPALSQMVNQLNHQYQIDFQFQSFGFENRVDTKIEKVLYRICQESVNNILKHSEATQAYIQLIRHEKSIVLIVEDNGIGFEMKDLIGQTTGIGLDTMNERVANFGGILTIQSSKNSGTELTIELPCIIN
ncbi:MAG: HAMP domain-containing protein [Porphyromonadaceae bacterium]|nr:MAG: HAMP domain-containing protein [Porphyromonadaceae bacterium]